MENKGNISIHAQNIMPVIKRWLYSDKDIFIREMVSNGCDAITKYRMVKGETDEDLRVTVTADKEKGVLVRWFDKPRLREHLRITVGSREQMEALLRALREILEGKT